MHLAHALDAVIIPCAVTTAIILPKILFQMQIDDADPCLVLIPGERHGEDMAYGQFFAVRRHVLLVRPGTQGIVEVMDDEYPAGIKDAGHGQQDLQTGKRPDVDIPFHRFLIRIQFHGIPPVGRTWSGAAFSYQGSQGRIL